MKKRKVNIRQSTVTLSTIAILSAMLVVISMYCTIKTEAINITLTFIPIVIAARLYGAPGAAAVAGLGDIIGWIFHPVGALYPPITITAMVVGVIFGLFLKNSITFTRILIPVLITQLIISAFVTPLWLSLLYNTPYIDYLFVRIPQILILTGVELILIPVILNAVERLKVAKVLTYKAKTHRNTKKDDIDYENKRKYS